MKRIFADEHKNPSKSVKSALSAFYQDALSKAVFPKTQQYAVRREKEYTQ